LLSFSDYPACREPLQCYRRRVFCSNRPIRNLSDANYLYTFTTSD
jgi:hypothetical protein